MPKVLYNYNNRGHAAILPLRITVGREQPNPFLFLYSKGGNRKVFTKGGYLGVPVDLASARKWTEGKRILITCKLLIVLRGVLLVNNRRCQF